MADRSTRNERRDPLVLILANGLREIAERRQDAGVTAVDPEPVIATRTMEGGRSEGGSVMGHAKWSEIKRQKGAGPATAASLAETRAMVRRAEAAWQASRRMIARSERPLYRVTAAGDAPEIDVRIVELPWLAATASRPSYVLRMGRAIVAEWLDVGEPDFAIERALGTLTEGRL